ncbi:MAG: AAA family ATPase [Candidatus Babeliales bacterium]|jgi:ATPase family AAA domain-containing protein 3A/B
MTIHKRLFIVTTIVSIISILNTPNIASQKQASRPVQEEQISAQDVIAPAMRLAQNLFEQTQQIIQGLNESMAIAHSSNSRAINAAEESAKALAMANRTSELANKIASGLDQAHGSQVQVEQQILVATKNLERKYEQLSAELTEQVTREEEKLTDAARRKNEHFEAKIKLKKDLGIYEQEAKVMAQANVETEKEKWKNIREIMGDSKTMSKIALAIIASALCIYTIKYGVPMLANYLTQPQVISETSKTGWLKTEWFQTEWFGQFKSKQKADIDDLVFAPSLQKQLLDLLLRVQSAREYEEALPNILFYGAPGTGKTAFVKALAQTSGLDYALTSGSEFAKITDLNHANNELRKLLNWAKKSPKGLIVFIDEAESLFANRKLLSTSKATQDFINTFLALISDQSQENVMFIFATNHPFKLDDAITNRIGINIEFTLPQAAEREKILLMYLTKFAQKNENAIINLSRDITNLISTYANSLEGFSPRAIKFVAEEMIIRARRQESKQLTDDIAQAVINETKHSLQQTMQWENERNEWAGSLPVTQMQYKGWF